ncbi:hypothetical protein GTY60_13230 [Streptomyces sp. SID8367]|nr:hypothetical protein [Streptomyces sp. SID8367]
MPSLTVVVSSDTDIYISPGLYGDCLPTIATGKGPDPFRIRRGFCTSSFHARTPGANGARAVPRGLRHIDDIGIVKLT